MDIKKNIKWKSFDYAQYGLNNILKYTYKMGEELSETTYKFGENDRFRGDISRSVCDNSEEFPQSRFDDTQVQNLRYIYDDLPREFKPYSVSVIEGPYCWGYYPIPITENKRIPIETVIDSRMLSLNLLSNILKPRSILGSITNNRTEYGTFFLMYNKWSDNYFHWHMQNLIKLKAIYEYKKKTGKSISLIVSPEISGWQRKTLEIMGFQEKDLYYWDDSILVCFEELLNVPSLRSRPTCVNWLRNMLSTDKKSHDKRIYISRADASRRNIINFDDIKPILDMYNFEIFIPGENSLESQINELSKAKVVVGPHGAGLTNILHAKSGAHLFELLPSDDLRLQYFALAEMLGHDYSYQLCETDGSKLYVDPNTFEDLISKIHSKT